MVRTGARAARLGDLLAAAGLRPAADAPPRPSGAEPGADLFTLYRALGGSQPQLPTLRPGAWDLVFDDPALEVPLVIELDEELHFNRYRALTLQAPWAAEAPWRVDYLAHCAAHEADCLAAARWGKRWTNPSCAQMFAGGRPGELDGGGAPRWKQRALYDALKEAAPAVGVAVAVARLATHDRIGDTTLGAALEGFADVPLNEVLGLVRARILLR